MKKLLGCSDEELVALAQTILNKYNKALADAKAIAVEYGFEMSESENKLLNIIFAKLKERRDAVTKESVEPSFKAAIMSMIDQGDIAGVTELASLFEAQKYADVKSMLQSRGLFVEKRQANKESRERGPKAAPQTLKVTLPDGRVICYDKAAQTLADVVEYIGFERVESLNWSVSSQPFVSRERYPRNQQEKDGWYVTSHSSTSYKKQQIEKLSELFGLSLNVEIIR